MADNLMGELVNIAGKAKKGIGMIKDADQNLQEGDRVYSLAYEAALNKHGDPEIATRVAERARKDAIGGRNFIDGVNNLTLGRLPLGPEASVAVGQYITKLKKQLDEDAINSNVLRGTITDEQVHKDMITK